MSQNTLKEIERAIKSLKAHEIAELYAWLERWNSTIRTRSTLGLNPILPLDASTEPSLAPWKTSGAGGFGASDGGFLGELPCAPAGDPDVLCE